jgi:hypothetical protein
MGISYTAVRYLSTHPIRTHTALVPNPIQQRGMRLSFYPSIHSRPYLTRLAYPSGSPSYLHNLP